MKIVNVIQGTNLGGMEQASLRLMVGLKERGHSCEVVSLNPIGGLGPLLKENNIPAVGLPYLGRWGWRSHFLRRRAFRSIQADALLMTGHNLFAMLALGDLCRGRRMLAIHFHHRGVMPPWQWRLIYRVACSRFQAITFPSDFVRNEAEELYPPVKRLSHTIYNPLPFPSLPTDEERRQARLALGLPLDVPVIGNAGWLIPRKRFDVFLRTAQLVSRQVPDALFLIAGDGEERVKLESLARELNIADRVKWIGWQKDMPQFYRCLDVMLFNSDWDAMGLAPLEALSHGVPIVASVLHGGLKEMIGDDCGMLIPSHAIEALAAKAISGIRNPQAAREVAKVERQRVQQLSDVKAIAKQTESLLT